MTAFILMLGDDQAAATVEGGDKFAIVEAADTDAARLVMTSTGESGASVWEAATVVSLEDSADGQIICRGVYRTFNN